MTKNRQQQPAIAVITGASAGIGLAAAKALAAKGWRIIGIGRDPGRTLAAETEIRSAAAGVAVDTICADLAILANAARAADKIAALSPRVDVLINNAGGLSPDMAITPEGNEVTFAGNHLGPFLLTQRLLPLLRAAAKNSPGGRVRIVNVSSLGHAYSPGFNWDDLQMLGNYSSGGAYCQAKLGNILFTRELVRRLAADGIVVHAMHPGTVASNFHSHANEEMRNNINPLGDQVFSPEEAAETLVWLADAEEPGRSTGGYFHQCAPADVAPLGQDDAAALRLWEESEKLVAKAGV